MDGLDGFPKPEPMNPAFEPVMIRGHDKEQSDKAGERGVACAVPAGLVKCDDAGETGQENRKAPLGEAGAGLRASSNEAFDSADETLQLCGAG